MSDYIERDVVKQKPCFGKCERCVWHRNGGCSEWNGYGDGEKDEVES